MYVPLTILTDPACQHSLARANKHTPQHRDRFDANTFWQVHCCATYMICLSPRLQKSARAVWME